MRRAEETRTEHKPTITGEDIKKLYGSGDFNTEIATTLQNKVFCCRRGTQNLRQRKNWLKNYSQLARKTLRGEND